MLSIEIKINGREIVLHNPKNKTGLGYVGLVMIDVNKPIMCQFVLMKLKTYF